LLVLAMRAAFAGARRRDALVALAAALIVAVTVEPYWGRSRVHAGPYIDVQVPAIPADSLVLTMTGQPFGYVVPFLPPGTRVIAPSSNFTSALYENRMQREMAALIGAHRGPLYAIRYLDADDAAEEATMAAYGLRRVEDGCQPIRSNLEGGRPLGLCPLFGRGAGP
jgi:hypothetical protein